MILAVMYEILLVQVFPLYRHQALVDQYKIFYDGSRCRRLYDYLDRQFCLFQYRSLYPGQLQLLPASLGYPLVIQQKFYFLRFLLYFFLCFVLRCLAILFVPCATDSVQKRILLGTEMFKSAGAAIETTFLFWSSIAVLFLKFSLSDRLLDYKFMALYRMTDSDQRYQHPAAFGLSKEEFAKFAKFRVLAFFYYVGIMAIIPPFGVVCVVLLIVRASLFSISPVASTFWMLVLSLWIFWVCSVIYSNLVAFIVVAKYIYIKQKSICDSVEKCLSLIQLNRFQLNFWRRSGLELWRQFIRQNVRFAQLHDGELRDYNHFWSTYLSFIFVFYVLLISFLIFIVFLSDTQFYVSCVFAIVLDVHIVLLSTIIALCGGVTMRIVRLSTCFTSLMAHLGSGRSNMLTRQNVKINNLAMALGEMLSGFTLLNGYLINYDTFRLLIINIGLYFILIVKD